MSNDVTLPNPASTDRTPRIYSTAVTAAAFGVMANTLRCAISVDGHYMGIIPLKLPNRLLAWPADKVDALLRGDTGAMERAKNAPRSRPQRRRATKTEAA